MLHVNDSCHKLEAGFPLQFLAKSLLNILTVSKTQHREEEWWKIRSAEAEISLPLVPGIVYTQWILQSPSREVLICEIDVFTWSLTNKSNKVRLLPRVGSSHCNYFIGSRQPLNQEIFFHHSGSCVISALFQQKCVSYLVECFV